MSEWDNVIKEKPVETTPAVAPITQAESVLKKEAKVQDVEAKNKKVEKEKNDERIKAWLFGDVEKSSSNVCCALYGFDGTAKSGIAMDCRSADEIKDGMKIIVFDLDGGCAPLKVIYHDNDKNIIIKNPLARDNLGNVDYEETFLRLKQALDYIERNLDEMKLKAIIFDGLDKFLKICEYKMRESVDKTVVDGIDYRYWKLRNQANTDILEQIKLLDVDRFFITHYKKDHDTDKWVPDWEKKTPDMMFQKVRCFREQKVIDGDKVILLKVEIEKCKTNLALEGRVFTISETIQKADGSATAKWNGLIFNKDNSVSQKKEDK